MDKEIIGKTVTLWLWEFALQNYQVENKTDHLLF